MVLFNLEYSILDKLGRAKSTRHVGVFKSESEVEQAKLKTQGLNATHKISFKVHFIDKYF